MCERRPGKSSCHHSPFCLFCSRGARKKVERLHFSCPHRCSMGLRAQRNFLFLPGCACHSPVAPEHVSQPGSRALTLTRGVFADVNCEQMYRGINYRAPRAPPPRPFSTGDRAAHFLQLRHFSPSQESLPAISGNARAAGTHQPLQPAGSGQVMGRRPRCGENFKGLEPWCEM